MFKVVVLDIMNADRSINYFYKDEELLEHEFFKELREHYKKGEGEIKVIYKEVLPFSLETYEEELATFELEKDKIKVKLSTLYEEKLSKYTYENFKEKLKRFLKKLPYIDENVFLSLFPKKELKKILLELSFKDFVLKEPFLVLSVKVRSKIEHFYVNAKYLDEVNDFALSDELEDLKYLNLPYKVYPFYLNNYNVLKIVNLTSSKVYYGAKKARLPEMVLTLHKDEEEFANLFTKVLDLSKIDDLLYLIKIISLKNKKVFEKIKLELSQFVNETLK